MSVIRHRRARASHRGRAAGATLVAFLVLATACSSPASTPNSTRVRARAPMPRGVSVYHKPGNPPDPTTKCSTNTASLTPGPLPSPGSFPAGSDMARIVSRGKLIAGVAQDTYLWGYLDPTTNQLEGFDIDTILQVARSLFGGTAAQARAHVTFRIVPNKQRVSAVQSGAVDIVAETMTINAARQKQVDFSSVYYCAGQRILAPTSSTIKSVNDLAGKRVCATNGSTSIANLAGLQVSPKIVPVQAENQTDCLVLLQQGQVDAVSTDDTILQGLAAQDPTIHLVGAAFTAEPYGLAINQSHPDFTRFVNAVLDQERVDGTWARLCRLDLGKNCPPGPPPVATYAG